VVLDEHEKLGVATLQFVGQNNRGAGLGADDDFVVFGSDGFEKSVLEATGRVNCAVDVADPLLGFVERATQRCGIGEVGGDGDHLGGDRFEVEHALNASRGRVVGAVVVEPALTFVAFGYGLGRNENERCVVGHGEVCGEHVADAAERAGDEVGAAATERGRVRQRSGDRDANGFGYKSHGAATGDDAVGGGEQLVDGRDRSARARFGFEVDEHGGEIGVLARRDEHNTERQRVDGTCGHAACCSCAARDNPESGDTIGMVAERASGIDRFAEPTRRGMVEVERVVAGCADDGHGARRT
jgi:hypothetical protein